MVFHQIHISISQEVSALYGILGDKKQTIIIRTQGSGSQLSFKTYLLYSSQSLQFGWTCHSQLRFGPWPGRHSGWMVWGWSLQPWFPWPSEWNNSASPCPGDQEEHKAIKKQKATSATYITWTHMTMAKMTSASLSVQVYRTRIS